MAKIELLGRRQLLMKGTKGAFAVALLGPMVVACSSDGDNAAVLVPTPEPEEAAAEPTTAPQSDDAEVSADQEPIEETAAGLQWERVDFDFVSAYVLVRGDTVAIVDTGTAGNDDRIDAALSNLGVGWGDVDHVILTHLHGDHVGGLSAVLDASETAVAYAGELDVAGISSARPITAVNGGDEVFGFEVIDTPGHTPGSISVIDETAGLLLAGDALNTAAGQVLGANADFSQDMVAAENTLQVLAERNFDTLVVGHGEPIVGDASALVRTLAESG